MAVKISVAAKVQEQGVNIRRTGKFQQRESTIMVDVPQWYVIIYLSKPINYNTRVNPDANYGLCLINQD